MMYYKINNNGFIDGFGTNGAAGTEITAEEFDALTEMFANRPAAPAGSIYVLRDSPREWVLVDAPPVEPEPLTDEEAITRYANELTGADDPDLLSAAETLITKLSKEES